MYCKNCGNQIDDKAVICTKCGCLTDLGEKMNLGQQNTTQQTARVESSSNSDNALGLIAKIFMIISTVVFGFYIIPLAWMLPMTINLSNKLKNKQPISTGFKICTLLFVNTVAGILLLCMKDEKNQ